MSSSTSSNQNPLNKPAPRPGAGGGKPSPAGVPSPAGMPSPAALAKKRAAVKPAAAASAPSAAAAAGAAIKNDPSAWGRIAEDGSVYLRNKAGEERVIGQWQAGTAEEGLAHYGKRYVDLATEINILAARLGTHPQDAAKTRATAEELKASLPEAAVLGDVEALERELDEIIRESGVAGERAKKEKEERRAKAIAAKEALIAEAEQIAADSTEWKAAGDRLRDILEEWKRIKGVDRRTDDALWKRFGRARDAFNRRRGAHFAELDRNRASARRTKEELVEKARALQDSTDWGNTARAYRELMDQWKAAGRAPREIDDKLWAEFRAAQDKFFGARDALNRERDKEYEANAVAKQALIDEYSPLIDPEKNLDAAKQKLRELQERWETIGYVPRGRVREFEDKIGALENKVTKAEESQWRRTDPEAQARAAQFRARVAEFEEQAAAAEAKGKTKQAEKFKAQAEQWREWAEAAEQALNSR